MCFVNLKDFSSILGKLLSVSAAYSGRIAVAYKSGKSFKAKLNRRSEQEDADSRYVNLVVSIYECESTGGTVLWFARLVGSAARTFIFRF